MAELLAQDKRDAILPALGEAGWGAVGGRDAIRKVYVFGDFLEAWGWMTRVAIICEKLNHHPEWLNVYRTVDVTLTTHDADGLSELDIKLAKKMDELAASSPNVTFQGDLTEPIACLCGTEEPS